VGEDEISGGKGRRVQRRAAKGSRKAKPKRRFFTKERRQEFLNHFAASCNAAAAARAVGVSENCVYQWRRKDAQFRAGFWEALDQGYVRLEAEIVREANDALKVRGKKGAAVRVGTMDAKTALAGWRRIAEAGAARRARCGRTLMIRKGCGRGSKPR
jgi:hypothetical protein